MIDGSFHVADAEHRIETCERLQTIEGRDLAGALAVEIVETGVTDDDVPTGPQCHPTLIERLAAAGTNRGRHARSAFAAESTERCDTGATQRNSRRAGRLHQQSSGHPHFRPIPATSAAVVTSAANP
jgi:hypothetical protein